MKNHFLQSFLCLVVALFSFSYMIQAQPIIQTQKSPDAKFQVQQLPTNLVPNIGKYGSAPYFQAFVIYGDGNFERIGHRIDPFQLGDTFDHLYPNTQALFPFAVQLISRKTDDDPPALASPASSNFRQIGILQTNPLTPNAGTFAEDNGNAANPTPFIKIPTNTVSTPNSPMISGTNDKIAIGLSHFETDQYFIKPGAVHVVPIAYKPEGDALVLLFYDQNPSPNVSDLEYYNNENLIFSSILNPNIAPKEVGTIIPNVFMNAQSDDVLIDRMDGIIEGDAQTIFNNTFSSSTFNDIIPFFVNSNEVAQRFNNAIVHQDGSSPELRLFHFLLADKGIAREDQLLVAALYDTSPLSADDQGRLGADNGKLAGEITLPTEVVVDDIVFRFVDADYLFATTTEPDDPNDLIIEEICKDDNEHIIDFKLSFENSEFATGTTDGAIIFLENLQQKDAVPLLTDFKYETCTRTPAGTCALSASCSPTDDLIPSEIIGNSGVEYCLDFDKDELGAGEGGLIKFSARIPSSEVDVLINSPVLRFCVRFNGIIDLPPICGVNKVLADEICEYIDTSRQYQFEISRKAFDKLRAARPDFYDKNKLGCKPNPIWENRDQNCNKDDVCKYCCYPYYWPCSIIVIVMILLLFWYYFRNRK